MTEISVTLVKTLREKTGAGVMACRTTLAETRGDLDAAIERLRDVQTTMAAKKAGRETTEGLVALIVDGRRGAVVEVNCETDFVARNEELVEFARQIAVHVASAAPRWVSEDDVPEEERAAELAILEQQADESKPPDVRKKISEGRLRKWLEEVVLLNQQHVNTDQHEGRTIEQIRADISAKTGENIVIRRFARFQVGD